MKTIVIVGAGAAGCFAAINAARRFKNNRYILLEASQKPLTKVLISGGGRCNVTHNCFDPKQLVKNYPRGSKELIAPFSEFGPKEVCKWYEDEGILLKAEADGRMFPRTNKSQTIANCLLDALAKEGVELRKGAKVEKIERQGTGFDVVLKNEEVIFAHKLMLVTGSNPVGYQLAESLGHTIIELIPSLFTFKIKDPLLDNLMGQSVPKATLQLKISGSKKMWRQDKSPLLVTHWGLSGPGVLKISAFAARELFYAGYKADLFVHWLGEGSQEEIFAELWNFSQENGLKELTTSPYEVFSKKMWANFVSGVSAKKWGQSSKAVLRGLSQKIANYHFSVEGKGVFKEEFVTSGGVKRSEVNFKTMESKVVENLYFAGEILDVDGITGGFNFQNAWTGSWIASKSLG